MLVLAVGAAMIATGCSSDDGEPVDTAPGTSAGTEAPPPDRVEVSISGFAFGPDRLTIPVGTTVVWTNDEDAVDHTATSDDGVWDSGTLSPGDSYELTFDEAGTFPYSCLIHPSMTATIVVEG